MHKRIIFLTLVLILCLSALPAFAYQPVDYATDLEQHWSKQYVWDLQSKGLIDGYPDGTFKPDQPVTRAEFTKMFMRVATNEYCKVHLVNTMVSPNFKLNQFKDAANIPDWAAADIEYAVKYGYINGYTDGAFHPNELISKVQAVAIIGRTMDQEYDPSVINNYKDAIPEWAIPGIAKAYDYGIIESNKEGLFEPDKVMTRGDIAKFLYIYYTGKDID